MQGDATTILISGSTGNIGNELIKQLSNSSSDLNLKAVVRSGEANINGNSKNKTRLQQVVMGFDRPETIVEGLKNVDKLFLLTPTHPKMVEFTSNLVNEAKKGGVKHIVKMSHIRADDSDDAASRITITSLHRQAEKIIEESGISYTFLRPNFYFQNFINFYGPMIKSQGSFFYLLEMARLALLMLETLHLWLQQCLPRTVKKIWIRRMRLQVLNLYPMQRQPTYFQSKLGRK